MSQEQDWESRYREWLTKKGFKKDPTAFEVFKALMEKQDKENRTLVQDLREHFNNIDVILQETPGERSNK